MLRCMSLMEYAGDMEIVKRKVLYNILLKICLIAKVVDVMYVDT